MEPEIRRTDARAMKAQLRERLRIVDRLIERFEELGSTSVALRRRKVENDALGELIDARMLRRDGSPENSGSRNGRDLRQKTPSGLDGVDERVKGVEPSTSGLESLHSAN